MAIEIFNRHEIKYLLDRSFLPTLQQQLGELMRLDAHCINGTYPISNVYYDTVDNNLIRRSISKPKYKEKVRLRGYGVPTLDDMVYLEIKKKVKGLVNKRRTSLKLSEGIEFLKTGVKPVLQHYMNSQVMNELEYIINSFELTPKLYLAYDRIAYFAKDDHDLRVTFDTNIRSRRYDLSLDKGDYGTPLILDDVVLMEVKTYKSIPLWMARLLSEYKLYKISFSKYGTEYKRQLQNIEERNYLECLI